MQIHSIQINDFTSISGVMTLLPSCCKGEDLTLIQGEDIKAVKTLYNACLWCLIGEDAFDEATAAGPMFNNGFFKYMIAGEVRSIQASMIFSHEGKKYLLRRRREYRYSGTYVEDLKSRSTAMIFCRGKDGTWQALPASTMSRLKKEIAATRLCLLLQASSCHEVLPSLGSEQHIIFTAKSELEEMMDSEDIWRIEQRIGKTYRLHESHGGVSITCVHDVSGEAQDILQAMKELPRFPLPGRPALEKFFNDCVVDILRSNEQYRHMGLKFPGAILLHGPSGSGKTYAVEALGEFLGWSRYYIDSLVMSGHNNLLPITKIDKIFEAADNGPSIIVIDDMDSLFSKRFQRQGPQHYTETILDLLRRIPSAAKNYVLIIGIANRLDDIDPAFLRRDRFCHIVEVEMPTREEMAAALEARLSKLPTAEDVDISPLAAELAGRPMSDLAFVAKEAGRLAAKAGREAIDQVALREALHTLPLAERASGQIGSTP